MKFWSKKNCFISCICLSCPRILKHVSMHLYVSGMMCLDNNCCMHICLPLFSIWERFCLVFSFPLIWFGSSNPNSQFNGIWVHHVPTVTFPGLWENQWVQVEKSPDISTFSINGRLKESNISFMSKTAFNKYINRLKYLVAEFCVLLRCIFHRDFLLPSSAIIYCEHTYLY